MAVATGCGQAEPGSGAPSGGSSSTAGAPTSGTSSTAGTSLAAGTGAASSAGTSSAAGSTVGGDVGAGGEPPSNDAVLLPWAVGNAWTYRVTKNGVATDKTTTIGALEVIGGTGPNAKLMANHVVTAKGASLVDKTESWQAPDPAAPLRILRYRELAYDNTGMLTGETYYDPSKIHIDGTDAHTVKGAMWTEKYTETVMPVGMPVASHQSSDAWSVVDDNETLKVPAGTFMHVIHFRKVTATLKEYWYARGIGKLKETGTQTEELVSYSLK